MRAGAADWRASRETLCRTRWQRVGVSVLGKASRVSRSGHTVVVSRSGHTIVTKWVSSRGSRAARRKRWRGAPLGFFRR